MTSVAHRNIWEGFLFRFQVFCIMNSLSIGLTLQNIHFGSPFITCNPFKSMIETFFSLPIGFVCYVIKDNSLMIHVTPYKNIHYYKKKGALWRQILQPKASRVATKAFSDDGCRNCFVTNTEMTPVLVSSLLIVFANNPLSSLI